VLSSQVINSYLSASPTIEDTELKSYWKFNEASGDIINQSESSVDLGSGADIQITGATYGVTGNMHNAVSFDGSNDFGDCGTSTSQFNFLHNVNCLHTYAWWLKCNSTPYDGAELFCDNEQEQPNIGNAIRMNGTSAVQNKISYNGGYVARYSSSGSYIISSGWHMYVHSHDQTLASANGVFYQDGSAFGATGNKENNNNTNDNATHPLRVMANNNDSQYFDGILEEVSIWNKIMSSDDVSTLYNGGSGLEIY